MAEILISSQIYNKREFRKVCGESLEELQCSGQHGVMWSYEPYTIGQTTREEADIIRSLFCGSPQNIHELSSTLGEDNVVGVSDTMVMLRDTTVAMSGSTTTVHAARTNEFMIAVQRYQDTFLAYRDIARSKGAAGSAKASAGQAIHTAFDNMQKKFQHELRITALGRKKPPRKGTPLTNSTRAMNIARSSRSIEKLQLVSKIQAGALSRFSSYVMVWWSSILAAVSVICITVIKRMATGSGNCLSSRVVLR